MDSLNFYKISSSHDVLSVLNEAVDYVLKVDGVLPSLQMAKDVLNAFPNSVPITSKYIIGIVLNNELIGFSDIIIGYPDHITIHIGVLVFKKQYQKKGFGTYVINFLADVSRIMGYLKLRAAIVDTNKDVYRFWNKLGFKNANQKSIFLGDDKIERTSQVLLKYLS